MHLSAQAWPWLAALLFCQAPVHGWSGATALPESLVPRQPPTPQQVCHRKALALYGRALLCERGNRLLEATRLLEQAVKLEPDTAALHKALVPLYLAASRVDDACAACGKTVELDPHDYEAWYIYGRQLKDQGRPQEAVAALAKGVTSPGLKEHPELVEQMNFELGVLYENAQDARHAEAAFREVLKVLASVRKDPDLLAPYGPVNLEEIDAKAAEIYERVVRICLQGRLYERAAALYQEARRKGLARGGRLDYQMARVYLGKGEPEKALHHLDEYLKMQPPGTDAYELRMDILKRLGRSESILDDLKYYAGQDKHNISLQLLLGRHLADAGKVREAEELYQKLADDSPGPDVYRGLFRLYRAQERMDEVLSRFDKTVRDAAGRQARAGDPAAAARARAMLAAFREDKELAKDLVPAGQKRIAAGQPTDFDTLHFLAVLAARSRQVEAAEKFYRECLQSPQLPQQEAEIYLGLLQVLWQARKHQEVVELCRQGLKEARHPSLPLLFRRSLPLALVQAGKTDEAIAEADRNVNEAGTDQKVYYRLARVRVLHFAARYEKAIAECQALLKEASKPSDVREIRHALSNVYSAAHDQAKAEEQLRLILKADPSDVVANNDLGYLMADQGKNLWEAEEMIRKAIRLDREQKKTSVPVGAEDDQDNAAYVDSLGWVLFRRGQLEAARDQLQKAAELSEDDPDPVICDHLGDVYFRLHDTAAARTAWEKAVKLYETEKRRKLDDQYKDLKHKLKLLQPGSQQ